ncbi:hypothetical protein [Cryptosporidium parvum Iowa II]|uniref:Uncharacterized protein n=2 Tax=Cryptosporidium parvum TaxID=5807 RepID=Q5CTH9_CRYPI|nr:hypothetical protein [Cryptosporidium parvum Iowa II]EAK88720.1 hypothetical protein cgd2_2930 [Cryptosporidium parvum Iowa II]WKS76591.1 hypothetical protein CPCDC_2g2930 [Cryptosporidium sp. 43IA8]WRK31084.1 Uncharacterized protein cpbgf_2002930 [Cryptosporidium parvum]
MDDYDSQSTVEDVSEWAEHIEDVIEELQRNYRIIQTEMSCLVEKLQVVNRPRNYISKRVVFPKRSHNARIGNENLKNSRNCCNNCQGNSAYKSSKVEALEGLAENILGIANEQYINNMVEKSVSNLERTLADKLDKNCAHHHLELQRNITDLKVQQSIMESTVRDIALQIQEIALELKDLKTSIGNRVVGNTMLTMPQKNQKDDENLDSNLNSNTLSSSDSSSCSCLCSCTEKSSSNGSCSCYERNQNGKLEGSKMLIYEILRDVFVEDENLVGIGNNLDELELENLCLIRQLFKDFVRIITQGRIETLEKGIGEIRNKNAKDEKNTEKRLEDINLLIKDELMNRSAESDMIAKLENRIQGVKNEVDSIQDSFISIKNDELFNKEQIERLEKELNNRSELIQSAIKELNDEYFSLRKKQEEESGFLFGDELSKTITDKISSIKDLVSYISDDLFKNEEKLQRQIKRNSKIIEELKSGCVEFEKYSDENFIEIANSLKNFRMQTITILSSMYEVINENITDRINVSNFQQKLQENFNESSEEFKGMIDIRPHIFSMQSNQCPAKSQNTEFQNFNVEKNSNSINQKIPPNAYHINN